MCRVLPVLMQHHHVGNGKAVSLKVFRVVDIKAGKNSFKARTRCKGRGIDQVIVRRINRVSRCGQTVVRLKAQIPRFVAAFELVNGKAIPVRLLRLCIKCLDLALRQLPGVQAL